MFSWETKRFKK